MGMGAGTVDILNAEALLKIEGDQMTREEKKRRKQEEKKVYKAYLDRISMPTAPRRLTPEEIEQLKKEGRI